jgi:tetratricopeptide (TPR) repeat protein
MQMKHWVLTGSMAFVIGFGSALLSAPSDRFDHVVRDDFFAGFGGNREAFQRAMKVAEETIAANPDHAEALVWHGAGLYFLAGQAFQAGDNEKGMALYQKGMTEMDKGVKIAPDNIGVRIPRGAALLTATAFQQMDERVRGELQRAVDDYQHTYEIQKGFLDKLGEHPLGQLLMGLGDGYSRLGETEKAKMYFDMIDQKLPGSPWAKRAEMWRKNGKLSAMESQCIGCHVSKN